MGAGAQLAAERDRWAFRWQVTDLDAEADVLLGALAPEEDLLVVVPLEISLPPASVDLPAAASAPTARGRTPALLAVTPQQVLVVGRGPEGPEPAAHPADALVLPDHHPDAPGLHLSVHGRAQRVPLEAEVVDRLSPHLATLEA